MAERPTEDTSVAPRRSLGGSNGPDRGGGSAAATGPDRGYRSGDTVPGVRRPELAAPPVTDRGATSLAESTGSTGSTDERRASASKPRSASRRSAKASRRPPRRARLRLTRIDPWSVMKTSFLLSIAFGIVTVVAVAIVWATLGAAGVWDSINQTVQQVVGGEESAGFNVEDYVGTSRVLGFTMLVAVVDVVLITAIATLGAFLYNMAAALLGGIEVTLAEDDH